MKETMIPVPPERFASIWAKKHVPDSMETAYFKETKIQRHQTFKLPTQKWRQVRIVPHSSKPRSHISFLHETNAAQLGNKQHETI
jgi:hypothetical protein